MTPSVVSAAEADYERNLANTIDLIYLLANDPSYGGDNRALFQRWLAKHADLADKAAAQLAAALVEAAFQAGLVPGRARRSRTSGSARSWANSASSNTRRTRR